MSVLHKKIRVMVVDDSAVARNIIIRGISALPNIEVVGYAVNAIDTKNKVAQFKPDVITMDVEMPGMSGIELIKELLPTFRVPVILVSSLNLRVFDALAAGAVDFVRKPYDTKSNAGFITALAQKIIVASFTKPRLPNSTTTSHTPKPATIPTPSLLGTGNLALNQVIIGLGASTGGTEATLEIMKRLPEDIPGMVIVQHMPVGFTKMYAERLNRICRMEVKEAVHGDKIRRGLALIAPADLQASVVRSSGRDYFLSCKPGEKVSGHRPSVDVLFQSMADTIQCNMVGIILTGMGRDGANGLLAMRNRGAYTIGQDKETSVVYGMPMVAHDIGAVQTQTSCENIANVLLRHLKTL